MATQSFNGTQGSCSVDELNQESLPHEVSRVQGLLTPRDYGRAGSESEHVAQMRTWPNGQLAVDLNIFVNRAIDGTYLISFKFKDAIILTNNLDILKSGRREHF
jgi:hypothetical protein